MVGRPEVDRRAPRRGDLAHAGDDDAQEMLAVDFLRERLAQVVDELVDDLLLLLQLDDLPLQPPLPRGQGAELPVQEIDHRAQDKDS